MKNKRIYIAGHNGMVGSSVMRRLDAEGFTQLIIRSRQELDLTNQRKVNEFFCENKPEIVVVAAAKVGGIIANNSLKYQFLYENLMIEANIINAAINNGIEKLIFLGSSCIYPKFSPQPIKEEYILSDKLEPTNEAYSIAKISGIKFCEYACEKWGLNFFSLMPANLYGANDYFNLSNSHVIPALMYKMHQAKYENSSHVEIWGSGKPTREFLFVDDLADAIYFSLLNLNAKDIYSRSISHLNIGTGIEVSIYELANTIKEVVGFKGELKFDSSKPDGMPRRLLDVTRMQEFGWYAKTGLEEGLMITYNWFVKNTQNLRV